MFKTLIVEDSILFRHTLKEIVCRQFPSMCVEEASNAREALKKVHTFRPDLIFMGIKLHGENGFKFTSKIRNQSTTTIAMIIPFNTPEYHTAALDCGANYVISKSASRREEIVELLNSIILEHAEGKG